MPPDSNTRPRVYPDMVDNDMAGNSERNVASSAGSRNTAINKSRPPPSSSKPGTSQSLNGKRPANSPINTNVEKRPRVNESTESAAAVSPAVPRQDSRAGTPYRRTSNISPLENMIHPSRENMIHPSRDPRIHRRGSTDPASPMNTNSPFSTSNGDTGQHNPENATPVHGAPLAPSMTAPKGTIPLKKPADDGPSRIVASIRQAVLTKQSFPPGPSENSALALLRAKIIEIQNQIKTEKKVRDQLDLDMRNEKIKRDQLESELKAEKTHRSQLEERIQKLEKRMEQKQTTPSLDIKKTVESLIDSRIKVQNTKNAGLLSGPDSVDVRIKSAIESEVEALEVKISTLSEDSKSFNDRVKQLIRSEISPLQTSFNQLKGQTNSLKTRLDELDVQKDNNSVAVRSNSTRVDELANDLTNLAKSMESFTNPESSVLQRKRIDILAEELGSVKKSLDAFKKETLPKQLADLKKVVTSNLSFAKDPYLKTLKDEDLPKHLSDLKMKFNSQDQKYSHLFEDIREKLSAFEKATTNKVGPSDTRLEAMKQQMQSDLNKHFDEQIAPLTTKVESYVQHVKEDVAKDIAELRRAVKENKDLVQTSLNDLESLISSSTENLRIEFESTISADIEYLRNRLSELDPSGDISEINIQFDQFKSSIKQSLEMFKSTYSATDRTATSSQDATLQSQFNNFQKRFYDQLKDRFGNQIDDLAEDVEKTMATAEGAKRLAKKVGQDLVGHMEAMLKPRFDNIEGNVQAIQAQIKTIHEQSSATEQHGESTQQASHSSLSRDQNEPNITTHDDTGQKVEALEQRLEMTNRALQSLEDRYANITTDELHQRMVHWITKTYPNAPGFLNEMNHLKQELHKIGTFTNEIGWMHVGDRGSQLRSLADKCDVIIRFFDAGEKTLDKIRELIAKGDQTESQDKKIGLLRDDLNAEREGRERLAQGLQPVHDAFRTSINELESRMNQVDGEVNELGRSKDDVESRLMLAERNLDQHGRSLEKQQQLARQAKVNIAELAIATAEHQEAIKALNNNPSRGVTLKFSRDFSKPDES